MIDVNDISLYKKCQRKQYDVWMCKPPLGTVVINRLEQYDLLVYLRKYVPLLRERDFLTSIELREIKESNKSIYLFITKNCYVTNKFDSIIIYGVAGELRVTDYKFICNNYKVKNKNGRYINIAGFMRKEFISYNDERVLSWHKVRFMADKSVDERALFIPKEYVGAVLTNTGYLVKYNQRGIDHGKGDFIVCNSSDLSNRYIVNGLVFSGTFSNKGWSDSIEEVKLSSKPQDLFEKIIPFKLSTKFKDTFNKFLTNGDFRLIDSSISLGRLKIKVESTINSRIKFELICIHIGKKLKVSFLYKDKLEVNTVLDTTFGLNSVTREVKTLISSLDIYKKYYESSMLRDTRKLLSNNSCTSSLDLLDNNIKSLSSNYIKKVYLIISCLNKFVGDKNSIGVFIDDSKVESGSDYSIDLLCHYNITFNISFDSDLDNNFIITCLVNSKKFTKKIKGVSSRDIYEKFCYYVDEVLRCI